MKNDSYAAAKKGKTGLQRIINAFGYSKDGLKAAYRFESAFRQLVLLNAILIIITFLLNFGPATRTLLIMASFISLITELFNTAIEAAVDHTSTEKHELAKRAKDAGSAAQLLALTLLALVWLMSLWREYGFNLF
ncbi:diacylglycerol kinase [Neisseria sp. N95_16]|uniref:Diacylglycerol kinase n=1 Tax=Neisseria brasiliensis TaxID=2666100 RepID=A0A5Q3S356_9NEIS|nr:MULTISPECIES: diacylglycerol kinase [Neisseria]MRN37075.1 diacylglycerol kinase [Neisseria brasiliensis]PJO08897.1 diacylglycerol kinase [Neisseria sp. N95_16]PJO77492.1 diacylglycerol kinase [Neisseria sp. N177_16]QGL26369.1 diacylglycerol kinase [Neisseria brasiliensis]